MDVVNAAAGISSAALSGAMGIASSRLNYKESKKLARDQYYYNMDLANRQNAANIEMWNMQNEYNSPQAQMARLKAAGLNPNMIYNNGSASTGNSTSPPEQIAAGRQTPNFQGFGVEKLGALGNMLSNILDLENKQAGIQNAIETNRQLKIQNELLRKDVGLKDQDYNIKSLLAAGQAINNSRSMFEYNKANSLFNYTLDAMRLANEKALFELTDYMPAQISLWNENAGYLKQRRKNALFEFNNILPYTSNSAKWSSLSEYENYRLRKAGLNPNDTGLMRLLSRGLGNIITPSLDSITTQLGDALKKSVDQFLYPDIKKKADRYFKRYDYKDYLHQYNLNF